MYLFLTFWSFNLYVIILFSFCEAKALGGIHIQIRSYVIVGVGKQWSIRLLSSCLNLELEVHRASKWEGKMGVQWKGQGQCAAAITGAKPLEDGVIPVPVHTALPLVVWCEYLPLVMRPNTHLSQESEQLKEDTGEGWVMSAQPLITPRDETGSVTMCRSYKMAAASCLLSKCAERISLVHSCEK